MTLTRNSSRFCLSTTVAANSSKSILMAQSPELAINSFLMLRNSFPLCSKSWNARSTGYPPYSDIESVIDVYRIIYGACFFSFLAVIHQLLPFGEIWLLIMKGAREIIIGQLPYSCVLVGQALCQPAFAPTQIMNVKLFFQGQCIRPPNRLLCGKRFAQVRLCLYNLGHWEHA